MLCCFQLQIKLLLSLKWCNNNSHKRVPAWKCLNLDLWAWVIQTLSLRLEVSMKEAQLCDLCWGFLHLSSFIHVTKARASAAKTPNYGNLYCFWHLCVQLQGELQTIISEAEMFYSPVLLEFYKLLEFTINWNVERLMIHFKHFLSDQRVLTHTEQGSILRLWLTDISRVLYT